MEENKKMHVKIYEVLSVCLFHEKAAQLNGDKCKPYKAFIVSYFKSLYSSLALFCGARNKDKLEQLNKRALRIVHADKSMSCEELLDKMGSCTFTIGGFKTCLEHYSRSFMAIPYRNI